MSEILKVSTSYDGGNLNKGLQDARTEMAQTAVAAVKMDSALQKTAKGTNQAGNALTNLGRVAQDAPFGFIGIQNNLNPLLESFQRLKAETGSAGGALKALAGSLVGAGGVGLALSLVSSAIVIFQNGISGFNKKTKEAKEAADELAKSYEQIVDTISKEVAKVDVLVSTLKNETLSREQRNQAIKELQRIAPAYFNNLSTEKFSIEQLTASYNRFNESIVKSVTARVREKELENVIKRIVELEDKKNTAQQEEIVIGGKIVKVNNARVQSIEEYQEGIKNSTFLTNKENDELLNLYKTRQRLSQLVSSATGAEDLVQPVKELKVKPKKIKIEKPKDALDTPFLLPQKKLDLPVEVVPKLKSSFTNETIKRLLLEDAKKLADYQKGLTDIIQNTVVDGLSGLGESIGAALGGGGLEGIFTGLFNTIATGLKQLGKYLIQTYAQIAIIKKIKFTNPVLGIAAGVALVALGSLISSQINKSKAFATGVRGFEGGTALVGERGPELLQLPRGSNVVPNAQTNAMLGGGAGTVIEHRISGRDLLVLIKRAGESNNRLY